MLTIVGPEGPACARMTIADYAALPMPEVELPEFAFSPRQHKFVSLEPGSRHIAPVYGPMKPILTNAVTHYGREVGAIEKGWLNYQPFFKGAVHAHEKTPVGTVPPLEGLAHFLKRVGWDNRDQEIAAIEATQNLELPTIAQELAQEGIGSFTVSSSPEDDDSADLSSEELNKLACRYGTAYTAYDLAPTMQRIEWEKQILACSQPISVKLVVKEDGGVGILSPSKDTALIKELARKLFIACGQPDAATVADMRAFADHYGVVGSTLRGKPKGAQWPEQSMDDLGAEDHIPLEEVTQGPQELGLHNLTSDDPENYGLPLMVLPEPHELDLWPMGIDITNEF